MKTRTDLSQQIILTILSIALFALLNTRCAQENLFDNEDRLTIDSISPSAGLAGSAFRIYGKGFSTDPDENEVTLNGLDVEVSEASIGTLLATVPLQATTGPVSLKSGNQSAEGPIFTIVIPPVISSISPAQGIAGYTVTITGSNLAQVETVLFNGVAGTITQKTETQIRVTAPVSGTGNVSLVYPYGQVTGPIFTYLPIPLIQSIDYIPGRISYFYIQATNVNQNPATLKTYLNNNEVPVLASDLTQTPAQMVIAATPDTGPNPNEVIVESLGIKSEAFVVTITPAIDDYYLEDLTGNSPTTRYFFNIAGRFLGSGANRSVQLKVSSSSSVLATATIIKWEPRSIDGEFTFTFPPFGPNDYFVMYVLVNGVKSNEVMFRMD